MNFDAKLADYRKARADLAYLADIASLNHPDHGKLTDEEWFVAWNEAKARAYFYEEALSCDFG